MFAFHYSTLISFFVDFLLTVVTQRLHTFCLLCVLFSLLSVATLNRKARYRHSDDFLLNVVHLDNMPKVPKFLYSLWQGENGGAELQLSRLQREPSTLDNASASRAIKPRRKAWSACWRLAFERHALPFSVCQYNEFIDPIKLVN